MSKIWLRSAVHLACLLALGAGLTVWLAPLFVPLFVAEPPTAVPVATGVERFGMSPEERHAIFDEVARREPSSRALGQRNFPGAPWSVEDDRSNRESTTVHTIARRRHRSVGQIYLVLDEGIREHWLGADGQPLPAVVPPLEPRRR